MRVFNPDRFFKRRTIFSSENFGPGDQNFQDQNSRDSSVYPLQQCLSNDISGVEVHSKNSRVLNGPDEIAEVFTEGGCLRSTFTS